MTESSGSTSDNWLQEQLQRWQEMAEQLTHKQPEQWQQFLNSFQGGAQTDFSDQQADLLNLVKAQSAQFSQFAESLRDKHSGALSTDQLVEEMQSYMQQQCNDLLSRQWNLPEPFASLMKNAAFAPETLSQAPFRELLEQLARSPEIGNGPYSPAQLRSLAQAVIDYQDSLTEYLKQYDHIFNQTGADLKQQLEQQTADIDSVKALQNLWIECYEKAYRDTVFTDQYQACHGRISNSLNRVRKLAFHSRDIKLKEFGLVTREELDSTIRQQHQLRKQLRRQQQEIDELRAIITSMKTERDKPTRSNRRKPE
ncbi:poly(R)-hydroxyalkanoic acid synthase, class III, PhaE subunit [Amphritea atlantica]|uniref:Poly(3-hydroxyalkanoate) polymerase subunit PhaE n=1 Tax=Amphritea atlantica TaxID=355243 RepID=A0A1H9FH01_9GAMM|nr:poly(R)-hydroxyalkanoic acid synthase subunit PhaE [Amphritea atlantica]SEQ37192.1 poly(R)-hydroxyalkanoic acid synthase, class III, PhaE subunit [Amphritea atlantica]